MNTTETLAPTLAVEAEYSPGPNWQRRYWTIFLGQAISMVGSAVTQFVLIWWITTTTGSASALAGAGLAALLPQALLGPLGGTFADHYNRRLLMIGADFISALCMGVLIILFATGDVEIWHVYSMMFIRSSMQAFQSPAASASVAMLVPPEFLARASGYNQSMLGIMTIAAAPLGALAMGLMPLSAALSIDLVTAVLGIVPLFFYKIPQHHAPKEDRQSVWTEFNEGVSLVWDNVGLRHLYILFGITLMVLMPTFTMVPLLVKQYFNGGAGHVAVMEGLAGVGMIAGGLLVVALNPKRRLLTTLWGFSLCCLLLGLTALAPPGMFWLAVVLWALSGIAFSYGNAPMVAVIQSIVPNQLQGRVLALMSTLVGFLTPLGLVFFGFLAEAIGVKWVFVICGFAATAVNLCGFLSKALLRLDEGIEESRS